MLAGTNRWIHRRWRRCYVTEIQRRNPHLPIQSNRALIILLVDTTDCALLLVCSGKTIASSQCYEGRFQRANMLWKGMLRLIITWLCDILALVWHFGPACVTFRLGLCDVLALSCVTKASACHHTPTLTTGAVYRKFHRSSVSKTT